MFEFLEMAGNYEERKVARDEVDGGTVDTCAVNDSSQPYETGIQHPAYNGGDWIIVELYATKAAAEKGHAKWVAKLRKRPKMLRDVNETKIEEFAKVVGTTTHGEYKREA